MKLIISGSRCFTQYQDLLTGLTLSGFTLKLVTEVVSGNARGTDLLGEDWARKNRIEITTFLPDWDTYGKRAGIIRNVTMANYADALISLWDNKSPGTKHMIATMRQKNKPYFVYNPWTMGSVRGNYEAIPR